MTSYNWVHSKSLRLWPLFSLFILLSIIAWIYVVGFFRQNFRRIDAIELVQRRFDFRLEFVLTYCAFVDAYSIAYQWFYLTCSNLRHIFLFHLLSTEKIVPRLMINCRNISNQITDSKTISNCGNLLRALLTFIHHYQFCHCFLFSVHRCLGCSISSLRHWKVSIGYIFKTCFFLSIFLIEKV